MLAGYPGWLSSHGLNSGVRVQHMGDMMVGAGAAYQHLHTYNITHITIPWKHRDLFNMEWVHNVARQVTSNGRWAFLRE